MIGMLRSGSEEDSIEATPKTIALKLILSPVRGPDGRFRCAFTEYAQGVSVSEMLPDFDGRIILDGGVLESDDPRLHRPLYGEHEVWAIPNIGELTSTTILIIAVVAAIGLSLASIFLFAPPKPDFGADDSASSPSTSFAGITTTQGPGAVIPVIYGRHRVGGQLLHADVGFNDQEQYEGSSENSPLDMLVAVGEGYVDDIEVATIQLNKQPVANFVDIETATQNGLSGQLALPNHEQVQQSFARSPADDLTTGTVIYTTTQPVTGFVLDIRYRGGLYHVDKKGTFTENVSIWTFRYRVSPSGPWSSGITTQNRGDERDVIYSTRKVEGLSLDVYDIEVEWASAKFQTEFDAWQPYLTNITELVDQTNAYADTALLGLRTISQSGLEGSLPNVTVVVKGRRVRVSKFSDHVIGLATNATPISCFVNTGHGYSTGDIIRVKGAEGNTAANGTWQITVTSEFHFTLDGSSGNGGYVSGSAIAVKEFWSDNPAWCLMDLMTHERYGLAIPDDQIDLGAFALYAAYCDAQVDDGDGGTEKRCLIDYVLDTDKNAQDAVLAILGTTRCMLIKSQGLWRPRISQNDAPVQLISWSNIIRDSLRIEYRRDVDGVNVMEGRFANRDLEYDADVITWPIAEDWPDQIKKSAASITGITRPSQAIRELQFELARRQLTKLFIKFKAGIDQIVLEQNDIFRFSHPLPGWGQAGRVAAGANTTTHIVLDEDVNIASGVDYHIYVRHSDDIVDVRVLNTIAAPFIAREFDLAVGEPGFSMVPTPGDALWSVGEVSPESAVKEFRVIDLSLNENFEVEITGVEHNPTVFNDEPPIPIPTTTILFNPFGPPPPLLNAYAVSHEYLGSDGIPRPAVRLSWEVDRQVRAGNGYARYGGALILRRYIESNAQGGRGTLGQTAFAAQIESSSGGYALVGRATGGATNYVDSSVIAGASYQYRIIPVSLRDITNEIGSLTVEVTVSGGGTQSSAPAAPTGIRLLNGDTATTFSSLDAQFAWDSAGPNLTYLVEIWDAARETRLRGPLSISDQKFTYTRDQNEADSARILGASVGSVFATRSFYIAIRSRDPYGLLSEVATLSVSNPAPDMSTIDPDVFEISGGLQIRWTAYAEPSDTTKYAVLVDTDSPPTTVIKELPKVDQLVWALGLQVGVLYYVQVVPYDIYGAGIGSQIVSGTPTGVAAELDTVPPDVPTGLSLVTGTTTNPDGTIVSYVEADWDDNTEPDFSHYQVTYRIGSVPFSTMARESEIRFEPVPGNTTIYVRVKAIDDFGNASDFTNEASLTTGADATAPAPASGLNVTGTFRANALLWTPPADADLDVIEIWARENTNDYGALSGGDPSLAALVGTTKKHSFLHGGLGSAETWYYWIRGIDSSGNKGAFNTGQTAGTQGVTVKIGGGDVLTTEALITNAAQIQNALINNAHINDLSASKIITGVLDVLVTLGVNNVSIDGVNQRILIRDSQGTPQNRVVIGKLGAGNTDWGIQVFDDAGTLQFQSGASLVWGDNMVWSGNKIGAGNISTYMNTAAIGTAYIGAAAITQALIANAAVGNAQIANLAVDAAKIANLAVDTGKIADLSVETLKIANNNITAEVIDSVSIYGFVTTEEEIASFTVSPISIDGGSNYGVVVVFGSLRIAGLTPNVDDCNVRLKEGANILRLESVGDRAGHNFVVFDTFYPTSTTDVDFSITAECTIGSGQVQETRLIGIYFKK